MHRIVRLLATGSAAFTVIGGTLGLAGTASAATPLSVTLSASGTGASAVWDAAGDPVRRRRCACRLTVERGSRRRLLVGRSRLLGGMQHPDPHSALRHLRRRA